MTQNWIDCNPVPFVFCRWSFCGLRSTNDSSPHFHLTKATNDVAISYKYDKGAWFTFALAFPRQFWSRSFLNATVLRLNVDPLRRSTLISSSSGPDDYTISHGTVWSCDSLLELSQFRSMLHSWNHSINKARKVKTTNSVLTIFICSIMIRSSSGLQYPLLFISTPVFVLQISLWFLFTEKECTWTGPTWSDCYDHIIGLKIWVKLVAFAVLFELRRPLPQGQ